MNTANLPLDILHWVIALVPIGVLLTLLVGFHWKGIEAGPAGMFAAALLALLVFQTPFRTLAVAAGKGIWDAVFILYVVWTALLLYLITLRAGAFDALRRGFLGFSRNELFLVLAIGWVFSTFFQGVAGFGAPIAVTAPLLVGIGMRPVYAVLIPLIAHTWAKMFGTLAVGWLAMLHVVEVPDPLTTAVETAILLAIVNLLGGLAVTWMYGRRAALLHALPLIAIIAAIQGGVQWVMMYINPILSTFVAGTAALIALYPLSRWRRYAEPAEGVSERPAMKDEPAAAQQAGGAAGQTKREMGTGLALFPYIFLTVIAIGALAVPPVTDLLSRVEVGFPFPAAETGYGVTREETAPYSPFAPLTHPGTFVLITALVALAVYRAKGFYGQHHSAEPAEGSGLLANLVKDAVPSSIAIASFLTMSKLMDHSGQTTVLAQGIASVASAPVYAFAANWIGILGGFMTSSSTASNILFSPLQVQAAQALQELKTSTVLAAQGAGGTIGNVIAPANIVIGTGAVRIPGEEGTILRRALPWALVAGTVTGVATMLLNIF